MVIIWYKNNKIWEDTQHLTPKGCKKGIKKCHKRGLLRHFHVNNYSRIPEIWHFTRCSQVSLGCRKLPSDNTPCSPCRILSYQSQAQISS